MISFWVKRKNYLILNWFILKSICIFFNKILGVDITSIKVDVLNSFFNLFGVYLIKKINFYIS
jgi:hypothetical protein